MTETITADTILSKIKSAVNVAGGDTHRQCYYALYVNPNDPNGAPVTYDQANEALNYGAAGAPVPVEPHCIVGTVLVDLGVPLETLRSIESVSVSDRVQYAVDATGVVIDPEGWEALLAAQSTQDDGHDWEQAQKSAENIVDRIRHADSEGYDRDGNYVHREFSESFGYTK